MSVPNLSMAAGAAAASTGERAAREGLPSSREGLPPRAAGASGTAFDGSARRCRSGSSACLKAVAWAKSWRATAASNARCNSSASVISAALEATVAAASALTTASAAAASASSACLPTICTAAKAALALAIAFDALAIAFSLKRRCASASSAITGLRLPLPSDLTAPDDDVSKGLSGDDGASAGRGGGDGGGGRLARCFRIASGTSSGSESKEVNCSRVFTYTLDPLALVQMFGSSVGPQVIAAAGGESASVHSSRISASLAAAERAFLTRRRSLMPRSSCKRSRLDSCASRRNPKVPCDRRRSSSAKTRAVANCPGEGGWPSAPCQSSDAV